MQMHYDWSRVLGVMTHNVRQSLRPVHLPIPDNILVTSSTGST